MGFDAHCSQSKLRRLVFAGVVNVNGRRLRKPSASLQLGDQVVVSLDPELFFREKQPNDIQFELSAVRILYEDEDLIAVDKPARLPTDSTLVDGRDNLVSAVKRYLLARTGAEPYLAVHHRLDRDTSGVILFAKRKQANFGIHKIFKDHLVKKKYIALCSPIISTEQIATGIQTPNDFLSPSAIAAGSALSYIRKSQHVPRTKGSSFTVENSLGRISPKTKAARWGAVKTGGESARTDFEVLDDINGMIVVLARPLTGRTHQIRVHLAELGLPLLGDTLYGGPADYRGKPVPRVMLHASSLTFPHPNDGQEICIEAPFPSDWQKL